MLLPGAIQNTAQLRGGGSQVGRRRGFSNVARSVVHFTATRGNEEGGRKELTDADGRGERPPRTDGRTDGGQNPLTGGPSASVGRFAKNRANFIAISCSGGSCPLPSLPFTRLCFTPLDRGGPVAIKPSSCGQLALEWNLQDDRDSRLKALRWGHMIILYIPWMQLNNV